MFALKKVWHSNHFVFYSSFRCVFADNTKIIERNIEKKMCLSLEEKGERNEYTEETQEKALPNLV